MSRTKKQSNQQRRQAEVVAKMKEWSAAKTPLQITSEAHGGFTLRPVNGDARENATIAMRTRRGLISITGLSPRPNQDAKKVEVVFPKDFSSETLMGKKPND